MGERPAAGATSTSRCCRVLDHGLTVGDGAFETIKTIGGEPFALTRHLRRMAGSLTGLGMTPPRRVAGCARASRRCWRRSAGRPAAAAHRDRRAGRRSAPSAATPVRRWRSSAHPLGDWPRDDRGRLGARGRATSAGRSAGLKTTSYAENVVALARRASSGAVRGDLRQHGRASCARAPARTSSYVLDGEVVTPTLDSRAAWPGSPARWCWSGATSSSGTLPIEVLAGGRRGVPGQHHPRRAGGAPLRRA